ncbi:COMM domain-containing protein 9 [Forsythia ovata]|uniref:COMM domain-containing protein 9 n=1 Tax=Forsythia ovata TaxID=205694 RepID=A0ABD1TQX4_9LAMI
MADQNHSLWGHLPLLVRANSKESVEYILQALWRTRHTGLDAADRQILRDILQLPNDSDIDPLLVCLRVLIRRCVYENVSKEEMHKLFPAEVLPELQRLLTLLLQKFQKEWREDISKDQVNLPRLKTMTWSMANQETELTDPTAVINLKLQSNTQPNIGDSDVKFQLAKDTLETMLNSMYCIRDQLTDPSETSERDAVQNTNAA